MAESRTGWVYVLTNEALPGTVKIGRSVVGVDKRCKSLNRASYLPHPFVPAWSIEVGSCSRVEDYAHCLLSKHRVRKDRELFSVSVETAKEAVMNALSVVLSEGTSDKSAAKHILSIAISKEDARKSRKSDSSTWQEGKAGMSREKALRLQRREKRMRIPALYHWLVMNYDRLKPRIDGMGGCVSTNEAFERIHLEWMDSLPRGYSGKVCRPMGLFMEWKRIEQEKIEISR